MEKTNPYYEKEMSINSPNFRYAMAFVAFSCTVGNVWGNPYISRMTRYTIGWDSVGNKHPYYGKSISINFTHLPHTMRFVAFSCTVGNVWGHPCISHMMKYTIGWGSNGKNEPILWEKYEYQFPKLSPYHGLCCISPYYGNVRGTPCISHIMKYTMEWESNGEIESILGKHYEYQFARFSPYHWFFIAFSRTVEMYGETHAFPIWWHWLTFSCVYPTSWNV